MYHFGLHWAFICCMYFIIKSSIGLHSCLILLAPTSTNGFAYPNSIWLILVLCCFLLESNIVLLFYHLFFQNPIFVILLISNLLQHILLHLDLLQCLYLQLHICSLMMFIEEIHMHFVDLILFVCKFLLLKVFSKLLIVV